MSNENARSEITLIKVVYQTPEVDNVTVRRDLPYQATDTGALTMDIYTPADISIDVRLPAVVFVIGYSDLGAEKILGCKFKEMESFRSWGKLTAATGLMAITYSTGKEPATDLQALLQYIRANAAQLGIDEQRIGLWACSGHVPNALAALMPVEQDFLKCAVLCYGYMLDLAGATIVTDAAGIFRFVNPAAGRSIDELRHDLPLLIVRAGQDEMPQLNETIDQFVIHALKSNLAISFINHPSAPHAFDLMHDSEISREIIKQILLFMRFHLLP